MENEIKTTTTSVSAMSGIPWKRVNELVMDCIKSGANINLNFYSDGSWNVDIYPSERQESISVPVGNTIYVNNTHGIPIKAPSDSISG